jgi:hypothetical protein
MPTSSCPAKYRVLCGPGTLVVTPMALLPKYSWMVRDTRDV